MRANLARAYLIDKQPVPLRTEVEMENDSGPISEKAAADTDRTVDSARPGLKSRILSEVRQGAFISLYLFVGFSVFHLYGKMILHDAGVDEWERGLAIVNALVLAKVILIARALDPGARLRNHRLVYSVLGHSFIFTIILIAFEILGKAIKAILTGLPLEASLASFSGGSLLGFLTVGFATFTWLIPLFVVQEVGKVVGGQALWDLFFSRRPKKFKLVQE
jgi:hypothetical protein